MGFSLITNKEEIEKIAPHYKNSGVDKFLFLNNGKIVAEGELEFNSGEDGSLEVKFLEVIEKRKGYGRLCVEHLKALPTVKELWGESVPAAVPFWKEVGAVFYSTHYEEYTRMTEFEDDFLLYFTISAKGEETYEEPLHYQTSTS